MLSAVEVTLGRSACAWTWRAGGISNIEPSICPCLREHRSDRAAGGGAAECRGGLQVRSGLRADTFVAICAAFFSVCEAAAPPRKGGYSWADTSELHAELKPHWPAFLTSVKRIVHVGRTSKV